MAIPTNRRVGRIEASGLQQETKGQIVGPLGSLDTPVTPRAFKKGALRRKRGKERRDQKKSFGGLRATEAD